MLKRIQLTDQSIGFSLETQKLEFPVWKGFKIPKDINGKSISNL